MSSHPRTGDKALCYDYKCSMLLLILISDGFFALNQLDTACEQGYAVSLVFQACPELASWQHLQLFSPAF